MRLVFMGTPGFAVPALEALVAAGHDIACVYTQPPRPAGRGQRPRPGAVQAAAERLGLAVRHPPPCAIRPSRPRSRRSGPRRRWWRPTG